MFYLFTNDIILFQIIDYPLTSTKSGRVCKPPKHLLNGEKITHITKNNSYLILENNGMWLILNFLFWYKLNKNTFNNHIYLHIHSYYYINIWHLVMYIVYTINYMKYKHKKILIFLSR